MTPVLSTSGTLCRPFTLPHGALSFVCVAVGADLGVRYAHSMTIMLARSIDLGYHPTPNDCYCQHEASGEGEQRRAGVDSRTHQCGYRRRDPFQPQTFELE